MSTTTDLFYHLQLRRIRAVTNTHRELPPVSMGHSVDEFFENLEEETKEGSVLPNWCVYPHVMLGGSGLN